MSLATAADSPDVEAQRARVEAQNLLQTAEASLEGGRCAEAREQFIRVLQADPDNSRAKAGLAKADALLASAPAAGPGPGDPAAQQNLIEMGRQLARANALLQEGKTGAAMACLQMVRQVAESFPNDARAAKALAEANELLNQAQQQQAAQEGQVDAAALLMRKDAEAERENLKRTKADRLYELALEQYKAEDCAEATRYVNRVLDLEPNHAKALEMKKQLASRAEARSKKEEKEQKENAFREAFSAVERASVVQNELLKLPDNWDKRVARVDVPEQLLTGATAEWQDKLSRELRQTVSLDVHGTPMQDVVSYLRDSTGVNIHIDPNCAETNAPVDLAAKDVELRSVLNRLCSFTNTHWAMADKMVLIAKNPIQDEPFTHTYDIYDLLMPPRDFRSDGFKAEHQIPHGKVADVSTGTFLEKQDRDYEQKMARGEDWVRFLRSTIAPGTWNSSAEGGSGVNTIAFRNGRLVVTHSPEVHRQILELLENFRKAHNLQVSILARFIDMNKDFLDYIGLEFGGLGDDVAVPSPQAISATAASWPPGRGAGLYARGSGVLDQFGNPSAATGSSSRYGNWDLRGGTVHSAAFENAIGFRDVAAGFSYHNPGLAPEGLIINYSRLTNFQVRAILEAVVKRRKGTILNAPRLTCFNGQRANLVVTHDTVYLRNVTQDQTPEIGGLTDGIIFEVVPYISSDQKYITMELQPTINKLLNFIDWPLEVAGTTAAGGIRRTETTIRLPNTSVRAVQTTVTIPDGGTLMCGGMAAGSDNAETDSVPFVRNIPIVKWLFSARGSSSTQTSLIILVRGDILIQGEDEPRRAD